MVALCVLLTFAVFIGIDYARTVYVPHKVERGTMYTTQGFEMLGALAQDGGSKLEKK